jgi:hypothetical protein
MKRKIIIGLLLIAFVLTIAVAASATTATKQIEATYRNIVIMANGSVVPAQPGMGEPFIVTSEGRTYVPIRMAAEALGLNVEWVDWLNAVKITGSTSASEIEALKAENASLKAKLEKYEGGNLADLEDDLIDEFDYLGDVEINDISLDGDEDDVEAVVEVDLDEYADEWEELSDSEIKGWIEDLVEYIQDELSEDTVISGKIIDIDSDDDLVKFSKNGESSLRVTFYDEDYRDGGSGGDEDDAIDALDGESYDVGYIEFTVTSVSYEEDDESVLVKLTADSDAEDDWDELDYDGDLEDYIIEICDDIVGIFDDEAGIDLETIYIRFYDDNGSLGSYEYDVDDEELY